MTKLRLPWSLMGGLMAIVAASHVLTACDWGFGPTRGLILLILLVSTLRLAAPAGPAPIVAWVDLAVWALLAAGAAMWIAAACGAIANVERTGFIPLDGGQTGYRAARLWLQGENPYGTGTLVDFSAYIERAPVRVEAGLATPRSRDDMLDALHAYDRTLDPSARAALLPSAAPGAPASVETQVLGYKYGPLLLLATLPAAALKAPGLVMALNALAAAAMVAALAGVVLRRTHDAKRARLAAVALLFDETILNNFVRGSATDVYPLAFCALAALAHLKGKDNLAATALALGAGFKIFPCLLLAPMLLRGGRIAPAVVFAALAAAIYLPFAARDPAGLLHNVLLWPLHMAPDSTSWLNMAPPVLSALARPLIAAGLVWAWARYLAGREPSLPRTLALVTLGALLGSGVFHNNYFSWASIWLVAAWTERFAFAPAQTPSRTMARLATA